MFKVAIREKGYSWNKMRFEFETLEEAEDFVGIVTKNYRGIEAIEVIISYEEKTTIEATEAKEKGE